MENKTQTIKRTGLAIALALSLTIGCEPVKEETPLRGYVIENAEILEFKGNLETALIRNRINTNQYINVRYDDIDEEPLNETDNPKTDLARYQKRPFALIREYAGKTNAYIYPMKWISPRRYVRDIKEEEVK